MKKLLSILAAVGLTATAGATVVACGGDKKPEEKSDFTVKIAADNAVYVGVQGKLQIDDYENVAKKFEKFSITLPSEGEGSGVVEKVGDFNDKGELTLKGIKEGTVKVQIKAIEKAKPATLEETKPVEKFSNTLEIKVTIAGLGIVKITDVKREVSDIKNVTVEEADKASSAVITTVDNNVTKIISGAKLGTDYTMDLTSIKAGDMSDGLTIDVKAKEGSTLIKKDSKTSVKVTFIKKEEDTRVDLKTIKIADIEVKELDNNASLSENDVIAAQKAIKAAVQNTINDNIAGVKLDTDYTLDLSKVKKGADLSMQEGVTFKVAAIKESTKLKEGTETSIKVTFIKKKEDTRVDLKTIKIADIEVKELDNNASLSENDVIAAQKAIKAAVQNTINDNIAGVKLDTDYTLDLSKVKKGADLSMQEGVTFKVAAIKESTKLKEGTETSIKVTFIKKKEDTRVDLSQVELSDISLNVSINITVSKDEAEALKTQVIEEIYSQLHDQFKEVTKADYTLLNLAEIKEGNLANGVDITITAAERSKIFKDGTKNIVKATVTSTEKNLAKVPLNDYRDAITDKTELTDENEVNRIRKDVKTYIESQINVIYAKNVEIDTDYIIDISAIIKGKLPNFVLVSVKPSENTTFFEKEEGKRTTIKVYYKEPKSK